MGIQFRAGPSGGLFGGKKVSYRSIPTFNSADVFFRRRRRKKVRDDPITCVTED